MSDHEETETASMREWGYAIAEIAILFKIAICGKSALVLKGIQLAFLASWYKLLIFFTVVDHFPGRHMAFLVFLIFSFIFNELCKNAKDAIIFP